MLKPLIPTLDLLDIIGQEHANDLGFCDSKDYWKWENIIAIPLLKFLGYTILKPFQTLEGDSCGPLSRGVRVMKNGVTSILWYG